MRKILIGLFALLLSTQAFAQAQLGIGEFWANPTAARAPGKSSSVTAIFDRALGSTRGSIPVRGAATWASVGPGTAGLPWVSNGPGADPLYQLLGVVGGGTGINVYALGDIICATGTTTLSKISDVATGNALISGGVGACPSYGKITSAHLNVTTTTCSNQVLTAITAAVGGTCSSVTFASIAASDVASLSQYLAGTTSKLVQSGIIYTAEVTTTFGTTTTFDFSQFINTVVTLTGNITTQTLGNVTAGKAGTITFIQDGTGSRTTVWNTVFKFPSGITPSLTTTAGAVDVLSYSCRTATFCAANLLKDVR